jgi:hypothetical protein
VTVRLVLRDVMRVVNGLNADSFEDGRLASSIEVVCRRQIAAIAGEIGRKWFPKPGFEEGSDTLDEVRCWMLSDHRCACGDAFRSFRKVMAESYPEATLVDDIIPDYPGGKDEQVYSALLSLEARLCSSTLRRSLRFTTGHVGIDERPFHGYGERVCKCLYCGVGICDAGSTVSDRRSDNRCANTNFRDFI